MSFYKPFRDEKTLFYWGWGSDTTILDDFNFCNYKNFILVDTGIYYPENPRNIDSMLASVQNADHNTEKGPRAYIVENATKTLKYHHPNSRIKPVCPFREGIRADSYLCRRINLTALDQTVLIVHAEGIMFFMNKFLNSSCHVLKKLNFDAWTPQIDTFLFQELENKLIEESRLIDRDGKIIRT